MSDVGILEQAGTKWSRRILDVDQLLKRRQSPTPTFIFVSREHIRSSELRRNQLSINYDIPWCFWTDTCQRLQGYFGSEDRYGDDGKIIGHNCWFHFEVKHPFYDNPLKKKGYKWFKMGFFMTWKAPDQNTVIIFNAMEPLWERLWDALDSGHSKVNRGDPYSMKLAIIEAVVACYDQAVWNLRDQIREFEEIRRGEKPRISNQPDFVTLHELVRHALHASETLNVAVETLNSMASQQQSFYDQLSLVTQGGKVDKSDLNRTQKYLLFQFQMLKSLEARSKANEARIRNEVTLAFNKVAQRDSAAMKAVAIVTMAFLPSTFVSAIFSTTFFDFRPVSDSWVSEKVWIYWVISLPLTGFTIALWYMWHSWQTRHEVT